MGSVYGEALYDLAKSESLSYEILTQITALNEGFRREPDYLRLLQSPNLPKQERCQILADGFQGKLHAYVLNFLKLLTEKGYIRHFPDCCEAYREHYNLDHNILPVTAVTAVALTQTQFEKLSERLSAVTGKTVALHNRIEPGILGGVRLDFDGKRLDDTVATRLRSVGELLGSTVL